MNDWFEIFRTGEHTDSGGNKRNWSEADLDKIAESYDPAKHEAPIVIGHPESNSPAYGWIDKLRRSGEALLALPRSVVPEFTEAVKNGLFKKRSVSLYPDGTLRHVGFLGAAIPAVKGLADIAFESAGETIQYEFDQQTDDYKDAELNAYLMKFSEAEERRKRAEQKLGELEMKLRLTEFRAYLNDKAAHGRLTPAQSNKLMALVESAESSDFAEVKKDLVPALKEFVETLQPQFSTDEIALKKKENTESVFKSPARIIADEIIRSQAVYRNIQY